MNKGLWVMYFDYAQHAVQGLWTILSKFLTTVIVFVIVFVASSCERRDLYEIGVSTVPVIVSMDWRNIGSDPTGASIYFYPEGGSAAYSFKTNSVGYAQVEVPSGYYTVLVFNRTVDEYATMHFTGMDGLGTAQAVLNFENTWAGTADSVGYTVYEPETIVCRRTDHFLVHDPTTVTVKEHNTDNTAVVEGLYNDTYVPDTCYNTPQRMIYTATINVRVDTIQAVQSVRGYITGMARGDYLSTRTSTSELGTHIIGSWKVTHDERDYSKGYLTGTFACFGLPQQYLTDKFAANNHLYIKILCADGTTTVTRAFDIGDLMVQNDEEMTVTATVGTITLPNVRPQGSSESGFDVSIEEWGDTIDVVVPM